MTKYIKNYMEYIEGILKSGEKLDFSKIKEEHLRQIAFVQHERIIHLMVMSLFVIVLFICIAAEVCFKIPMLMPLILLLLALIIPYVFHYHFLENNTQKMYAQYNLLTERENLLNGKN
ncbi:MAG: hypothetical protein RR540_02215 [Oscillospiraceae bacterium]